MPPTMAAIRSATEEQLAAVEEPGDAGTVGHVHPAHALLQRRLVGDHCTLGVVTGGKLGSFNPLGSLSGTVQNLLNGVLGTLGGLTQGATKG